MFYRVKSGFGQKIRRLQLECHGLDGTISIELVCPKEKIYVIPPTWKLPGERPNDVVFEFPNKLLGVISVQYKFNENWGTIH